MKIGIVNDLAVAAEALRRAVTLQARHEVVWIARDGAEGVRLCAKQTPDLILMDLVMPIMDGVEATRRIMAKTPCAILIVTVSVGANASRAYEAMGYGALDAVDAPTLGFMNSYADAAALLAKIDTIGMLIGDKRIPRRTQPLNGACSPSLANRSPLVVIGASAGGPAALATVLSGLPSNFPAAVVLIQHVDERFADGMAQWLCHQSPLPVRVAKEDEQLTPGNILMAGTQDHLILKSNKVLGYTPKPIEHIYRPSIDVFFESVSQRWGGLAVGVLLTGMGRDGAIGLRALRNKGHYTIAQDEASSAVYGMPKAAVSLSAAVDILPLDRIAHSLTAFLSKR